MWEEDQRANRNIVQSSGRLIRTTIFAEHLDSMISPLEVVKPRNSVTKPRRMILFAGFLENLFQEDFFAVSAFALVGGFHEGVDGN